MKIRIEKQVIETREITAITEYVRDRFYDRHCGFKIELYQQDPVIIEYDIPYERTPGEIHRAKSACRDFMQIVIAEWEKDKVVYEPEPEIPVFKLNPSVL
jgi:hypothetical protein